MASRKKTDEPRNDALAVLTGMFGDSARWDKRVAAATDAALIAEEVYALRQRHGLSQAALARLIDSSQPAIARLEDAKYRGHSVSVLRRIAAAVGEQVIVRFVAATPPARTNGKPGATRTTESAKPATIGVRRGAAKKADALPRAGAKAQKRVRSRS